MTNLKRHFEEGYSYFVTTITFERRSIFSEPKNCQILLVTLEYFKLILDYRIFAFCLMPDHIHLILQPYGQYDLSYIMKMIKGSFARKYNKSRLQYGKVWQDRYYETGIRDSFELIKKVEYTHNNPVRANIVSSPEEYPFSSFRQYFCYSQQDAKSCNFIRIDKLEN